MAQISLAWAMQRDGMLSTASIKVWSTKLDETGVSAPIVGTTSLENLKDLIGQFRESNCSTVALLPFFVQALCISR